MSAVAGITAGRQHSPKARGASLVVNYVSGVDALSPDGHWRLSEASGTTLADRVGANDATAVNSPSLSVDPLVEDSNGGGSIGLKGGTSPAHATVADLSTSAVSTFDVALQVDDHPGAGNKFMLLDNGGGTLVGEASIELEDDGASGLWVRCWSTDANPTPIIKRTNAGTVPIGTAFKLSYRRHVDGTQSVLIDGVAQSLTAVSGSDPASWPVLKSGTWALGAYVENVSLDPFKGVISELVVWDSVKSDADLLTLAKAQDVLWLDAAIDMGDVQDGQTKTFLLGPHVHPEVGYTVEIDSQPSGDESVAVNGLNIDLTGGTDAVSGVTFTFHVEK